MCAYVGQGEGGGSVMNFYDLYMSWLILLLSTLCIKGIVFIQ